MTATNGTGMTNPASVAPDRIREGVSTGGGGRNWPKDCWWVAAHGSEVSDKPVLRWILELPIAIYRKADGELAALHNRCPHRWAPLSMGEVVGDDLACPYHGMRFAPSGQCTLVPTQEKTPSAIRVQAFPVIERYGFVWVWTGDSGKADPALIPDELAYLDGERWHMVWGYKAVNANYMQIKENVLDLTHFAFLHKNSLQVEGWDRAPKVELTEDRVTYRQLFDMAPLPPVYAVPAGKQIGKPVNRDNYGSQLTAGAHHAAVDMHDPDPGADGLEYFKMRIVHLTTPVAIGKTHYYWAMARDHGEPYDYAQMRGMADVVFGEDIAMLEATQEMACRSIDQEDALEFSVTADHAGVEGRRKIAKAMAQEQSSQP